METAETKTAPMYTAEVHTADMHAGRVEGLPDDAYWQMTEASIELRRQGAAEGKAFNDGRRAAADQFQAHLRQIIGESHLDKYQAARALQKQTLKAARQNIVLGRESAAQFDALRRRLVNESHAFLDSIGVDRNAFHNLGLDYAGKLAALFDRTLGHGESAPAESSRKRNHTFLPPFSGSSSFAHNFFSKGDSSDDMTAPTFNFFLSFQTGEMGSSTACAVSDASDYDESSVVCRSAMRQWFQMPALGQVRVSNLLEVINSHYSGSVYDEWGWSTIDLKQGLRYYAQVTSPTVGPRVYYYPLVGWQNEVTDEDAPAWSTQRWPAGQNEGMFVQTVLPGVIAKNTWVLVDVGVENSNWFLSNDVTVTSHQTARYWTKNIGLSSTGS
ncbi:MAG TPA: hypothetical protein VN706_03035 [Gemmatimonadaceae bacterium]|nr:hypothetical protein [Gemmatimonadaceae bacterium]